LWSLAERVLNCIPNFRNEPFFIGTAHRPLAEAPPMQHRIMQRRSATRLINP